MIQEIRSDVLSASEKGNNKYQAFHSERVINQSVKLKDTIHKGNLKTMASFKDKTKRTVKTVIKATNMTDKSIKVAREVLALMII